jgi:branched-chain amino acid transport system ATP-binding protein
VSVRAAPGEITAILGANGTGKSTLLKTIAGHLRPEAGSIRLDGSDLAGCHPHRMLARGVAYIPQLPGVFDQMTVEENLLIGAWGFRRDRARVRRALAAQYERFPMLAQKRRQKADELSGGQQRMVELGRALLADARVLLVDEPTAGLAKLLSREVYDLLGALRDDGCTVLLVDQEIRQALKVADQVFVLDLGRNRLSGAAHEFTDLERTFWSTFS